MPDKVDLFVSLELKEWLFMNLSTAIRACHTTMSTSAAGLSNCDNRLPVPGALRVGVRWQKPPLGWCKLNTDVAVSLVTSEASCDGVVHDDLGS
ncbi:hypothetical protein V6N13_148329 [Hibiscus sabdariffa]